MKGRVTPIPQADEAESFAFAWRMMATGIELLREYRFHYTRDWRFDFAFPSMKLAVEVDGGQHKLGGGRHGSDEDREKLNQAALMGWRVFHFSPKQLSDDPAGCVELVVKALTP